MDLEAINGPSIDGLIAGFECHATEAEVGGYIYAEFEVDIAAMRALIASWRERGEALAECVLELEGMADKDYGPLKRARAALDKS